MNHSIAGETISEEITITARADQIFVVLTSPAYSTDRGQ